MADAAARAGRRRCRQPRRTTPSAARTCARGSTCCRRCRARGRRRVTRWRGVNRRFKTEIGRRAARRTRTRSTCSTRRWSARGRSRRRRRHETPLSASGSSTYMTKALREAKVHTSWLSPDEEYERAVARFVRRDPRSPPAEPVPQAFAPFQARVAELGHLQQPRAAADQDHRARRARFLSGHRAVGSDAGRSRQPPPGRLRRRARAERARGWRVGATPIRPALRRLLERRRRPRSRCSSMTRALATRGRHARRLRAGRLRAARRPPGARRDCVFAFARGTATPAITCVPRLIATLMPDGRRRRSAPASGATRAIELPARRRGLPRRLHRRTARAPVEALDGDRTLSRARRRCSATPADRAAGPRADRCST